MNPPENFQERRKHPRTQVSFTITYKVYNNPEVIMLVGGHEVKALMLDLSIAGMAIETEYNVPVATVIFISFTLINLHVEDEEKRSQKIDVVGIVRNNILLDARDWRLGIEFTKIAEEDKTAIDEFIHMALKK